MYANINYDIIAYLVELISGEIFVDYCKNYIFQPLEMFNTSFNLSELDINNVALPYHYHWTSSWHPAPNPSCSARNRTDPQPEGC